MANVFYQMLLWAALISIVLFDIASTWAAQRSNSNHPGSSQAGRSSQSPPSRVLYSHPHVKVPPAELLTSQQPFAFPTLWSAGFFLPSTQNLLLNIGLILQRAVRSAQCLSPLFWARLCSSSLSPQRFQRPRGRSLLLGSKFVWSLSDFSSEFRSKESEICDLMNLWLQVFDVCDVGDHHGGNELRDSPQRFPENPKHSQDDG